MSLHLCQVTWGGEGMEMTPKNTEDGNNHVILYKQVLHIEYVHGLLDFRLAHVHQFFPHSRHKSALQVVARTPERDENVENTKIQTQLGQSLAKIVTPRGAQRRLRYRPKAKLVHMPPFPWTHLTVRGCTRGHKQSSCTPTSPHNTRRACPVSRSLCFS